MGQLIDLSGTYDLSPIPKDETVVTDYLLNDSPSGIINIVDASQLKRDVQLAVQLLELNQSIYIELNTIDVVAKRGIKADYHKLMKKLKTPTFPVVARTGKGTKYLLDGTKHLGEGHQPYFKINYGEKIEETTENMCQIIMTEISHDKY